MSDRVPCTSDCGVSYHIAGTEAASRCKARLTLKTGTSVSTIPPSPASSETSKGHELIAEYGIKMDGLWWDEESSVDRLDQEVAERMGLNGNTDVDDDKYARIVEALSPVVQHVVDTTEPRWRRVGTFRQRWGADRGGTIDLSMGVYRINDEAAFIRDERDHENYTMFVGYRAVARAIEEADDQWGQSSFAGSDD